MNLKIITINRSIPRSDFESGTETGFGPLQGDIWLKTLTPD